MALSPTSSSTPKSSRVNVDGADLCALAALALAIAAPTRAQGPSPAVSAGVAGLLFAVATAYLLSRTIGIPGLTEDTEPFDTLGTVTSLLDVAAVVVAVRPPNPRRHR